FCVERDGALPSISCWAFRLTASDLGVKCSVFDVGCFLSFLTGTNSIPHLGHLPGWSRTTSGCMTQVYCVVSGFGVCARSAEPIVTIKIRVRNFLSIVEVRNTSAGFSPAEAPITSPRLSCAAVAAGAAPGATTAISAPRGRGRCANHGQGGNNHQKVLHAAPPVEFDDISLTRERADANRRSNARRWNRRTVGP